MPRHLSPARQANTHARLLAQACLRQDMMMPGHLAIVSRRPPITFHPVTPSGFFAYLRGKAAAERLACSPPTKANRVQLPAGHTWFFAHGNCAGQCRWSSGFLGDFPVSPVLAFRRCSILTSLRPHRLSRPRCQEPPKSLHSPLKRYVLCPRISRVGIGKFREFKDLYSAVLCILEPQLCVHWLLPQREASVTPRLAVWDSLLVSFPVCYWFRVVQSESNKLRTNYEVNFSVHIERAGRPSSATGSREPIWTPRSTWVADHPSILPTASVVEPQAAPLYADETSPAAEMHLHEERWMARTSPSLECQASYTSHRYTQHDGNRKHCTPVQRLARRSERASGARANVVLIGPALPFLKRAENTQVGGALKSGLATIPRIPSVVRPFSRPRYLRPIAGRNSFSIRGWLFRLPSAWPPLPLSPLSTPPFLGRRGRGCEARLIPSVCGCDLYLTRPGNSAPINERSTTVCPNHVQFAQKGSDLTSRQQPADKRRRLEGRVINYKKTPVRSNTFIDFPGKSAGLVGANRTTAYPAEGTRLSLWVTANRLMHCHYSLDAFQAQGRERERERKRGKRLEAGIEVPCPLISVF
ncbi:hypothetical protein PR048_033367 [Dryococelus australis]|uniref:Uncharacterized protein n=1 Tax=Dryococelus australis TaxID=614101 RepID=A0ABQ9G035_9NEOP|nr:hypothetical protein PR048_033367 [Dryococelus australis]